MATSIHSREEMGKRWQNHWGNFLTTNSTNFHECGAASPENFIVGFIRVHSCPCG